MEQVSVKAPKTLSYLQLPFVSATAPEQLVETKAALRKRRRKLRKPLGGIGFSLGSRGNVQLANPAMMSCLMAGSSLSNKLVLAYRKAGLAELVQSEIYVEARELAIEAVQRTSMETKQRPTAEALAGSIVDLYNEHRQVRRVTSIIHRIMHDVDMQFEEVENIPGRIVRIEGDEALVVIQSDGRNRLQAYPTGLLKDLGIGESQRTFVMQKLNADPLHEVKIFFPALDLDEADDEAPVAEEYNLPRPPRRVLERFGLLELEEPASSQVEEERPEISAGASAEG